MSSVTPPNTNALQRNPTLTSSKTYSHFKGNDAKKKISFEVATHKYQQKKLKECLKLVKENPDKDPLFFRNDSLFSSFGPNVSHGAQMFLALTYCKENKGVFHFAKFKKSIENLGFHDIAKELKESYFKDIRMLKYDNKDVLKLDKFTSPYFASLDVFVKPDHIPTQVIENKDILRKITSFCGEKEILNLASTCAQAQRLLFSSQGSLFTHTIFGLNATLTRHTASVLSLIVLPDGRLASGSGDRTIKIWNPATRQCEATLTGHTDYVLSLIVLPDGRLASGSGATIKIWNLATELCEGTLTGHTGYVLGLIVLPDGRLASGAWDGNVKIWNLATELCEETLTWQGDMSCLIILPDGRLASGAFGTIKIWNLATQQFEATPTEHMGDVSNLTVLPDGRLASGSGATIKIWNLQTQQCEATLMGHPYSVRSLIVLPGGRLASSSGDRTIKIWNLRSQQCEATLWARYDDVVRLIVLPDGRLASGSNDGTIQIWETRQVMPRRKPQLLELA